MARIFAPFSEEQVKALKNWQEKGFHPFTCCSFEDCKRSEQKNEGELIPYSEGWICPCGKYTQDWCHDFMLKPFNPSPILNNNFKSLTSDDIDEAINGNED